jgi:hypothetical protein
MASAVRVNCNLLLQKESKTKFKISLRPIVIRRGALTVDAVVGVTQGGVAVAILSRLDVKPRPKTPQCGGFVVG